MKSTQSCSHVIIEIYTNICGPFVFATTEAGDWIIFSIYMWLLFVILGSPEIDTSIYANLETCLIRIKSCGFGFHEECHNMAQRRAKHECQMRWTSNRYSTSNLCSLLNILWTDQTLPRISEPLWSLPGFQMQSFASTWKPLSSMKDDGATSSVPESSGGLIILIEKGNLYAAGKGKPKASQTDKSTQYN